MPDPLKEAELPPELDLDDELDEAVFDPEFEKHDLHDAEGA